MAVPNRIEDVHPEWLTTVLGEKVVEFEVEQLEGAVLSDVFRLADIHHDGAGDDAPSSVVVKMPCADEGRRAAALASGAYATEVTFYRELASEVPIRTPHVYSVQGGGRSDADGFILVMEDLATHSRVFDQVTDPPDPSFVDKIALDVASMHAKYFESEVLDRPWISEGRRFEFSLDANSRASPAHVEGFLQQWRAVFGEDVRDTPGAGQAAEITAMLTGERCDAIHEAMCARLSRRPRTLIHCDLRADNIFRSDAPSGEPTLTYIDWQIVTAGPTGTEFTQCWQHSLPPEERRRDVEVLRRYHERLVSLAPAAAEYTYDMLLDDYRTAYLFWWSALITIGSAVIPAFGHPAAARMKALWGQGIPWSHVAMTDLDCLSLLEEYAG